MAFWTMPFRADAVDNNNNNNNINNSSSSSSNQNDQANRDAAGFYWQDMEQSGGPADVPGDLFGQFVDFEGEASAAAVTAGDGFNGVATTVAGPPPDSLFMMDDHQHHHHRHMAEGTVSSGVSTADELDFLSTSSQIGPTVSAASHEIDPRDLALGAEPHFSQQFAYPGRASMSETDLSRLEGISLHSPQKIHSTTVAAAPAGTAPAASSNTTVATCASDPTSPTPPDTAARRPNRFVEALSSTIRKATTLRKPRKPLPEERSGSPTLEPHQHPQQQQPLKLPRQRRGRTRTVTHDGLPHSPPIQQQGPAHPSFIHGFCEDPFGEGHPRQPPTASSIPSYYGQAGIDTPLESPGIKTEFPSGPGSSAVHVPAASASWPQPQPQQQQQQQQQQQPQPMLPLEPWTGAGGEYVTSQEAGWWELGMFPPGGGEFANHHRNVNVNLASHAQHSGLPYEYARMPDTGAAGLMIHMPQPRTAQHTVVSDLTVNAQTYLPPPLPPAPTAAPPKVPASERPHRPPRAKSSGARHLSCSPMRKQRGPSASPTPGQQQQQHQQHQQPHASVPRSRHSSGASISSVRSASGRLPGSMPGTPCSVRKRRSRDVSASVAAGEAACAGVGGAGGGGGGGSGDIGFVNFTPSDGSLLMTGVAPSGSSKTKARREKEAQERRRRLSEAALKAVAAAGGDVDKLIEQGFAF